MSTNTNTKYQAKAYFEENLSEDEAEEIYQQRVINNNNNDEKTDEDDGFLEFSDDDDDDDDDDQDIYEDEEEDDDDDGLDMELTVENEDEDEDDVKEEPEEPELTEQQIIDKETDKRLFNENLKENIIKMDIIVPPSYFHEYRKYISERLKEYEQRIVSNEYGYVHEILEIKDIVYKSMYNGDHTSSIIFDVTFTALTLNPKPGDIMKFRALKINPNILSRLDPLLIYIKNEDEKEVEINDVVIVKVEGFKFYHELGFMKLVTNVIDIEEDDDDFPI